MLKQSLLGLSFVVFALSGCGGDDTTTVTTQDLSVTGPDLAGAHLVSGPYAVSSLTKVSDGCGLVFEGDGTAANPPLATLQITNTGTMLSMGTMFGASTDPIYTPPGYSGGTGPYTDATHATLTTTTTVTLADGCTYDKVVTTTATFTGMNALSIDFQDVESNYDATTCAQDMPPMVPTCTSEYTMNLAM